MLKSAGEENFTNVGAVEVVQPELVEVPELVASTALRIVLLKKIALSALLPSIA